MKEPQHSPLPWQLANTERGGHIICGSDGKKVATAAERIPIVVQIENENLILQAVNSYYKLKAENQNLQAGILVHAKFERMQATQIDEYRSFLKILMIDLSAAGRIKNAKAIEELLEKDFYKTK